MIRRAAQRLCLWAARPFYTLLIWTTQVSRFQKRDSPSRDLSVDDS